jgi:peptidyl-prolyl cis-trans isomerase B (cyclophilin B)
VVTNKRRRQLAREKYERQRQRRAEQQAKIRRRNAIIAVVVAVCVLGGGGLWAAAAFSGDDSGKSDSASPADSATPSQPPVSKAPDPCAKPAKGAIAKKTWKKEPAMSIDKSAKYSMSLDTTCGKVDIALDAAKAPHTVNSFAFLAKNAFFDHTKCHRLVTQGIYVLQCGDPTGQGSGGPGYTIPDEDLKDPAIKGGAYPAGTVAMANTYNAQTKQGRNTGGSQFFLVFQDSPLPPDYTPFGKISSAGMKVLQKIAKAGTATGDPDGPPNATVVINKATVTKA